MPLPLETERLLIRAFSWDDLAALHETVRSDPEVMRYIPLPASRTVDDTAARLKLYLDLQERGGLAPWAVEEKASGELAGLCGIFPAELVGPEIEIAYIFGQRYWGRGYATEAARACLALGFEEYGFDRILAVIMPGNTASIHVVDKLGMRFDGVGRHYDCEMLCYVASRAEP